MKFVTVIWNARNGGGVMTKGKENKLRQALQNSTASNVLTVDYKNLDYNLYNVIH